MSNWKRKNGASGVISRRSGGSGAASAPGVLLFLRGKSALLLAVVLLIVSGVVYRSAAAWLGQITETPITLAKPLSEFPAHLGNWHGEDRELTAAVLKVAGNDDYLNRLYINERTNQWANVYVAYTARPRTMLGHRPQVCYVGSGWIPDSSKKTQFTTIMGQKVDCLIHRFRKPAPDFSEVVVVNFYILNGQVTNEEEKFAGIGFRTPNIGGDAARYVAQIQISSVMENSVWAIAEEISDLIIDYFPSQGLGMVNGK